MRFPKTLTVDLSPEATILVRQAVASGRFPDANAAVDAAVHGWSAGGDSPLGYSMDELRRLGDVGERSGPGRMGLANIQRQGLRRASSSNKA